MATKSQLKQYFETGKIPTQAQFGELIDYIAPMINDNNNNKTIIFGDNTKPLLMDFVLFIQQLIIQDMRIIYLQ